MISGSTATEVVSVRAVIPAGVYVAEAPIGKFQMEIFEKGCLYTSRVAGGGVTTKEVDEGT